MQVVPGGWVRTGTTTAALTNSSLVAAPGAGKCIVVTDVHFSNEGAANTMTLLDGSGGTVVFGDYMPVSAFETVTFRTPIRLTADTALCATTTASDHCFIMVGYRIETA